MRISRSAITILLTLLFTTALHAKTRAVAPPTADVLGIGPISGSALSGTVASVSGTLITLNTGTAAAIRIDAANAKFSGRDGASSIADVTPGSRITAFLGTPPAGAPGSPLKAQLINIEPPPPDLAISGPIDSIDVAGSKFVVLGITITVDSSTRFTSAFPTFAPIRGLGDLLAGQTVVVDATAGSAILARHVLVVSPTREEIVTLRGRVKSISDKSWVITETGGQDRTIVIDERTKISGDPKVGDEVQVLARVDSASNTIALAILELGPPMDSKQFEFHGYVVSIHSDHWSIGGPPGSLAPEMLVKITPVTSIYPNPAVGDRVVVVGIREPMEMGAIVALKISKEN